MAAVDGRPGCDGTPTVSSSSPDLIVVAGLDGVNPAFEPILISETTSNTVSASVGVPIIIPVAAAAGADPMVPALAATFAASVGFMLPVSTPQNAIVYGSGVVPITQTVRNGFFFDVVGAVLIVIGIPILVGVLGI